MHSPSTQKGQQQQEDCEFKAGLGRVAKPHGKGRWKGGEGKGEDRRGEERRGRLEIEGTKEMETREWNQFSTLHAKALYKAQQADGEK